MKQESHEDPKHGRSGFTLVEMLLVVAIIGILATVVVVNFAGKAKGAMIKATRGSIMHVGLAIDMYENETGRLPPSLQSLISNDGSPNWNGPYIRGGLPADSWGTPFSYTPRGDNDYEVRSAGPDLQMGSGDDITSFINEGK